MQRGGLEYLGILLSFIAEIASECRAKGQICCATYMKRWLLKDEV